jgi:hypothetical protein
MKIQSKSKAHGNIERVKSVSVSSNDFEDDNGFFIRAGTAGNIKYCPLLNPDSEAITKAFTASTTFCDPEICRKIFSNGTTAEDIFVGYGV